LRIGQESELGDSLKSLTRKSKTRLKRLRTWRGKTLQPVGHFHLPVTKKKEFYVIHGHQIDAVDFRWFGMHDLVLQLVLVHVDRLKR